MSLEALLELMGDEDFLAIGERKNPKSYEVFVNRINKDLDLIMHPNYSGLEDKLSKERKNSINFIEGVLAILYAKKGGKND